MSEPLQVDMAFLVALDREQERRAAAQPRQMLQLEAAAYFDTKTEPLCRKVGHKYEVGKTDCVFCGKSHA